MRSNSADSEEGDGRDRRIAAGLFVLAFVSFSWFYGGAGWNQDAHFDMTRAVVEQRRLYVENIPEYPGRTGDISLGRDGHTFINKPPGVSLIAAVPYAAIYAIERVAGIDVDQKGRVNSWLVTAATCGVAGAATGALLYLFGRRRFRASAVVSLSVALIGVFATLVFPYSTMLFAQVPAGFFLLLALYLVTERPLLAGVAAGIAVTCFYLAAIGTAAVAVVALMRSPRSMLRFIAGALPFAVLLALYQWYAFGSPLRTSVEVSTFTDEGLLFGVLRIPQLDALYGITFSPYRGLFYTSPVLIFALVGLLLSLRSRVQRSTATAALAVVVGFFLANAAFNHWHAGWVFGARYVVPAIPLMALGLYAALSIPSRLMRAVLLVSALLSFSTSFVATATDAMPAESLRRPVTQYLFPAFFHGAISEETRAAFPWYGSTRVDKVALPRDAGNVGELIFGEGRRSSAMIVVLWIVGGAALLFREAREADDISVRSHDTCT